jgi:hypothetical protein
MLKLKNPLVKESKVTAKGCFMFRTCQSITKLSPQSIPVIKKETDKINTTANKLIAIL